MVTFCQHSKVSFSEDDESDEDTFDQDTSYKEALDNVSIYRYIVCGIQILKSL